MPRPLSLGTFTGIGSITILHRSNWLEISLLDSVLVTVSGFYLLRASSLIVYSILLNQRMCIFGFFFLLLERLSFLFFYFLFFLSPGLSSGTELGLILGGEI